MPGPPSPAIGRTGRFRRPNPLHDIPKHAWETPPDPPFVKGRDLMRLPHPLLKEEEGSGGIRVGSCASRKLRHEAL